MTFCIFSLRRPIISLFPRKGRAKHLGWGNVLSILVTILFVSAAFRGEASPIGPILHFSSKNGLKSNRNLRVFEDKRGFYWFGSSKGVQRFDGYEFREFPVRARASAVPLDFEVFKFFLAADSTMLVGSSIGLLQFDEMRSEFVHVPFSGDSSFYRVIDICAISDSTFLINSFRHKGICIYNKNSMVLEKPRSRDTAVMNNPMVRMMLKGPGSCYFFQSGYELYEYSMASNRLQKCAGGSLPANTNHHYGLTDAKNTLWLLSETGLYCKKMGGSFARVASLDRYCPLGKQIGSSIIPASDSSIYVAFDWWGIAEISIQTQQVVSIIRKTGSQLPELPSSQIYSLYRERDGSLWICNDGGAYRLANDKRGIQFIASGQLPETANYAVLDIMQDSRDSIWVGTDGGGLHRYTARTGKTVPVGSQAGTRYPQSRVITALHEDRQDGSLWIGTYGDGLYQYKPQTGSSLHFMPGEGSSILKNKIADIAQDRHGSLIIGYYSQILGILDKKAMLWKHLSGNEGQLRGNHPSEMAMDGNGDLWLGYADDGIDRYNDASQRMENCAPKKKLSVNSLYYEGDTIWIGSTTGLMLYSKRNKAYLQAAVCKAFAGIRIADILKDSQGRYWIASSNGLFYFRQGDKRPTFSTLDGYFGNTQINCLIETREGLLIMGGANGLLSVPTSKAGNGEPISIKPRLTDFRLFGKTQAATGEGGAPLYIDDVSVISLPYSQNYLGFSFSSMAIANRDNVVFSVRVSNYYPQWQKIEPGQNRLELPNLQPGTYQVEIKASLKKNEEQAEIKKFTIVILPPWWKTWWFQATVALLLIASLLLYNTNRIRQAKKDRERLESLVAQRTESLRSAVETLNEAKLVIEIKNEELQETLAMKDRLIGIVGHDFKNPLSAILNLLELTKMQVKVISTEKLEQHVDALLQASHELTSQMLAIFDWAQGRFQKSAAEPVNINIESLIRDAISLMKENARQKNITITAHIEYTHTAFVDVRMIHTVFRNLLSNALKFTPEYASIMVLVHEDDAMLEVSFIDSGIGIASERIGQLFETSAKSAATRGTNDELGMGFGLQICRQFVEQNQGTIAVASTLGKGSVFTVRLPKGAIAEPYSLPAEQNSPALAEVDAMQPGGSSLNYSVLLIDDNEELLSVMQDAFAPHFMVLKAADGRSGLYFAQNSIPDIIVCDINLPGISGLELCAQLKQDALTKHIPVVMVSGERNAGLESECYAYGATDFIAKPFAIGILKQKVHALLQSIELHREKSKLLPASMLIALPETADNAIIRKIIDTISQNIENSDFNIDLLAQEIGLSRTQFWRKTKTILGKSPSDLIRDLRLQRAAEMIASGKYRVSEVAYHVGFTDPRYFSRCFSKAYSLTPTEYYEKHKKGDNGNS